MYEQYYNILSSEESKLCKKIISDSFWKYGQSSNSESSHKFWILPKLEKYNFFTEMFFSKIEQLTNSTFKIYRIYGNGQSFGQDGEWHIDSIDDDDYTFLYYFNEGDVDLIGDTYFADENGILKDICKPIFNSGIIFKSKLIHKGCAPNVNFNDLRITIAFKLKKINIKSSKTLT
jgi:hypothetical protein